MMVQFTGSVGNNRPKSDRTTDNIAVVQNLICSIRHIVTEVMRPILCGAPT